VLFTNRRHQFFKVPEHALFCERSFARVGKKRGWSVEAVHVTPNSAHVLIRTPAGLEKNHIAAIMKRRTAWALVKARVVNAWVRLWAPGFWCVSLSNATSVAAVRRHIRARHLNPLEPQEPAEGRTLNTPAASGRP
jgi:REP element-mobilizing transposase RayT